MSQEYTVDQKFRTNPLSNKASAWRIKAYMGNEVRIYDNIHYPDRWLAKADPKWEYLLEKRNEETGEWEPQ